MRRRGYLVRMCLVGAVLAPGWVGVAGPAGADVAGAVLVATVDGQGLSETTASKPIVLDPQRRSELAFELRNEGAAPLVVHQVLLVGRVMAIRFFSFAYTLPADLQAAPGEAVRTSVPLDLPGLRGQVVGLLDGRMSLVGPDGRTVASDGFVMDARGSLQSVSGVLGIVIGVATGVGMLSAVVAVARRRLSPDRWSRAFRFLVLGVGLGLSLVFALSIGKVLVPELASCARLVLICAGVLFLLGFLSPGPPIVADDE